MRTKALLLLLMLALTLPSFGVQAQASGLIYVVQPGDSLTSIAERFATSVQSLMTANGLVDPGIIQVGWRLHIPGFPGVTGELYSVQVGLGEDLASLSLRYGIPSDVLIRLNRLVNPERIYAGQNLVLPESGGTALHLSESDNVLPSHGSGLLQTALLTGSNPWTLTGAHGSPRLWALPGETLPRPAGSNTTQALPKPIRSLQVSPDPFVQGRTAVITVMLETAGWVSGSLGNRGLSFLPIDTMTWVAVQGVHAMAEPGLLDLEIELRAEQDGALSYAFAQPIRLTDGGYHFDPVLSVPAETLDPAITGPEDELIAQAVNKVTHERLSQGRFVYPASETSAFSSLFGSRRNYNNTGYNRYHSGLDFFAAIGDPIFAAGAGRVVLVEDLVVRGLTTVIDHGWGVHTLYMHQSEAYVSVGDVTAVGDLIGRVGSSGRSTGAHLHWEVNVGGVPVDPIEWVEGSFP